MGRVTIAFASAAEFRAMDDDLPLLLDAARRRGIEAEIAIWDDPGVDCDTARWTSSGDVYAHSAELMAAGRTSMTQPYIASVDDEGETAMLFFGGRFSHAIRKGAILARGEGVRQDRDGRGENPVAREPSEAQHRVAAQALAAVDDIVGSDARLMYARVDLVTASDGSPLVIELELTEPSLFLPWSNGGAERLMDAIANRV